MEIDWSPGIGDPTFWGWITVAAYFLAASLSVRSVRAAQLAGQQWQSESLFWLILAVALFGLGLNKQLDLQTLLTELVRAMAKEDGWYRDRRAYQEAFIFIITALGAVTILIILARVRKLCSEIKIAATGLIFVICFVVIRAASFHKVDALISSDFFGMNWNALLELPGILLVLGSALAYSQRTSRTNLKVKRSARHQT